MSGWRKKQIMVAQPAVPQGHEQEPVGEVINERGEVDWISFVPSVGTQLYTIPPQPEQETVTLDVSGLTGPSLIPANWNSCAPNEYTTSSKREWEGLSVFEINDLVQNTPYDDYHYLVEKTEALLKEKNT